MKHIQCSISLCFCDWDLELRYTEDGLSNFHDVWGCSLDNSKVGRELEEGIYVYLSLIHVEVWTENSKILPSNYPSIKNKLIKKIH